MPVAVFALLAILVGTGETDHTTSWHAIGFALFAVLVLAVFPALAILQAELRRDTELPDGEWKWWMLAFFGFPPAALVYWFLHR